MHAYTLIFRYYISNQETSKDSCHSLIFKNSRKHSFKKRFIKIFNQYSKDYDTLSDF